MKGKRTADERLAARYWDLLDFYPRGYRAERGDELVATLLDGAGPGQTRPTWRESRALILEGLRMRAGTSRYRSRRATLAAGVQWGVLILLVDMTVGGVTTLGTSRGYGDVREVTVGWAVLLGLAVLAGVIPVVLLARGFLRSAVPFVVAAGIADMIGYPALLRTGWADHIPRPGGDWPALLPIYIYPGPAAVALLGTAALIWLRPPPMSTRATAVVVLLPVLWWTPDWLQAVNVLPNDGGFFSMTPFALLIPLGYLGIMAYAVIDARPAGAFAVLLSVWVVEMVATLLKVGFGESGARWYVVVYVLVLVLPVGAAAWLGARRQARLHTPDAVT